MKRRTIGHYEFLRKIGAGGSGVVYLATDMLLQRPVL
jgi:eukaryotic-like serine/threonine-protein kinase